MSGEDEYTWQARRPRCRCEDADGVRDCYCYEAPHCICEECQSAADAGRADRMADYADGLWL